MAKFVFSAVYNNVMVLNAETEREEECNTGVLTYYYLLSQSHKMLVGSNNCPVKCSPHNRYYFFNDTSVVGRGVCTTVNSEIRMCYYK